MVIRKGTLLKIISIIPVTCLIKYTLFFGDAPDESIFSRRIIHEIFSTTRLGDMKTFVMTMDGMFFLFLFNLLFGTYIYKEFGTSSVYLFTRLKNRSKWLTHKSITLTAISAVYVGLYLCTLSCIVSIHKDFAINLVDIQRILLVWFMLTMYTSIMTILINYLSIRFGSAIGFVLVFAFQMLLFSVIIQYEDIPDIILKPLALYGNPASMVALGMDDFSLQQGALAIVDFLWLLTLILIGAKWINKFDIALSDQETNG